MGNAGRKPYPKVLGLSMHVMPAKPAQYRTRYHTRSDGSLSRAQRVCVQVDDSENLRLSPDNENRTITIAYTDMPFLLH